MKIKDIMLGLESFCQVEANELLKTSIEKMDKTKIGIICVVEKNKLIGVMTDGDIRRKLLNSQKPLPAIFLENIVDNITKSPSVCFMEDDIKDVISIIDKKKIWDLPVLNENGQLVGLFHLHHALKNLINI